MDNPNITMEEYIRLQEEKALSHGETFDWQTATYGKMEYCKEEDESYTNFKTEYPAIVFDDTSDAALSCEPTVSPLDNNEIDFKISFDESDDEDYMVIFDENSFSYKIISVDNLKMDSENENDKVNMPSSSSPEPMIGYIDDLDFFKDFKNEFPAIAYNDLKSRSDPIIEPSVNMAPLPSRDQRHPWLRYQVEGYGEDIVHSYEQRLETIWGRMSDTEIGLDVADTLCFQLGGGRHIRRHAEGRKSRARLFGGYFIGRLATHFGLVSDQGLRGLSVVASELPLIDLHELERLNICLRVGDTWSWVAPGPERQSDAAAPQPPPPAPRTIQQRVSRLEEEVQELRQSIVGLRGDVARLITDQSRFSTRMISCMTQLMDASGRTYQAFDSTLVGPCYKEIDDMVYSEKDVFIMDDPNITMEEYIRLEEEKAQRHGRTFNWQSATYGKIEYCEDEDNRFTNFRTEYPTIVFDDTLTSDAALSCEPTVTPLNKNESDFKISFDESDDEDYMPMISHSDDLNFFKDFENEFPTITYDDDLTSKLTEPSVSFQHIKEFDLINETSLSKYDEEVQKVLYFNDSFPLNIVFPNNLKSKKDIDDDEIDVTQSSGRNAINIDNEGSNKPLETSHVKI
ncbi:hypothetical protein Tco_0149301 [Tanacetum coccineum]